MTDGRRPMADGRWLVWLALVGLLFAAGFAPAHAQTEPARIILTGAGYRAAPFVSPSSPSATLEKDDEPKQAIGRFAAPLSQPIVDWKRAINEKIGLQLALNYQAVFLTATSGVTDQSQTTSASGVLSLPVRWALVRRGSGWEGAFTVVVENRHVYGNFVTPPQNLGFDVGTILPTAVKFSRMSTRVLVMHWGQSLGDRAGFVVGQLAPDDYFNHYQLIHPFLNFFGYGSSISPTGNWPNPGFGIAGGVRLTKRWYAKALLGEAGGYRLDEDVFLHFGENFFDGQFFTAAEVGWVQSWEHQFANRFSLTAMHSDTYAQSPDQNWAIALASNWTVHERWVPFFLAGIGNGRGENTVAKGTVTVGVGHNFRTHDVYGGSINWTQPPGGLRDQFTFETYYRFYLTPRGAVTPNVQIVYRPALDPNRNVVALFGVRIRADL